MHNFYHKVGLLLAESLGLLEFTFKARNVPLYTQSKEELRLARKEFQRSQKAKAPQNRFRATMSRDQQKVADQEFDTKVVQSGKRL